MKFILEVDLARVTGEPGTELGRILRYWGGAMKDIELTDGATQALYDSEYQHVGRWIVTEDPDA